MKNFNLINIQAYEFQADPKLLDEVLLETKKLIYIKNKNNYISKHPYYNLNLYNWFKSCLNEVKNKYYNDNLDLEIVACWVNKSTKLQAHHKHKHTNSLISGIFYLTSHQFSETVFYFDNPWTYLNRLEIFEICKFSPDNFATKTMVTPIAGKLILFPSHIEHSVKANNDDNTRYTISFNSFFSGNISNQLSTSLTLKTNSV